MVYKEITLDTWQQPLGEIRVIQEEADGRELIVNLFDNGSPLDLTGKKVSIFIQKPDNTMIYNACTADGNTVTAVLTGQMMAAYGVTRLCELQIIDADNHTLKVTLPPLRIIKSNYDGAVESTDEFSRLTEALNEVDSASQMIEGATAEALAVKNDLIEKRDSGFFNGAPGTQGPQGIQGPKGGKGEKGDRGDSGIQAAIDGMYTLYVNAEGHLIAQYTDTGSPPPLSIVDGHLIYNTGE